MAHNACHIAIPFRLLVPFLLVLRWGGRRECDALTTSHGSARDASICADVTIGPVVILREVVVFSCPLVWLNLLHVRFVSWFPVIAISNGAHL